MTRFLDRRRFRPATVLFIVASAALIGSAASLFAWLTFSSFQKPLSSSSSAALGCRPDGEGSWSIGVFYGDSPFTLRPIESWDVWRNETAAWPVANPIITCASASEAGFPSNFVADPFLYIEGDTFYLFFETKNPFTWQGDIGVATSKDKGATWKHLGIALDEKWHLSYPYVFSYQDQVFMLPESSKKGELRLYRAVDFPMRWELEKVILKKPLIDAFIVQYQTRYWLFGSDFTAFGAKKNGELEIWYSDSPLGPWEPHKQNPVHNIDKSLGARNAGRPFVYNGDLYRTGQDCGFTYGWRVRMFKVTTLTVDEYRESEIPFGIEERKKGRNSWNGARYHQLDVQQLPTGEWVGVMDGDRVHSGDSSRRFVIGYLASVFTVVMVVVTGVLLGVINCIVPISRCLPMYGKRRDGVRTQDRVYLYSKMRWVCTQTNKLHGRIKPNTCTGRSVLALLSLTIVAITCISTHYLYGGNGAEEAYPSKGHYSQFTLLTMTYDARLWNLKMLVKHYSRCASVREIVVVWNKGTPPDPESLDSAVPVRIRSERKNSLNNRFNPDPSIKTRAVLELDDDIMMTCDDVERGFKVWRDHPNRIVGFYPRLAEGPPLLYRDEKFARRRKGYNMILTGAAFIDGGLAFERYWSEAAAEGRKFVDEQFNCEDLLLNFLYWNASSSVEYVRPSWAIDTSKFSGVAISGNTQAHYKVRSECLVKFTELYGKLAEHRREFSSRGDGWDV